MHALDCAIQRNRLDPGDEVITTRRKACASRETLVQGDISVNTVLNFGSLSGAVANLPIQLSARILQ